MTKVKLAGRVDNVQGGTLMIDKKRGLISVRPKGRRRVYELPVLDVANLIVTLVVKWEIGK